MHSLQSITLPWMGNFSKVTQQCKFMGGAIVLTGDAGSGRWHVLNLEAARVRVQTEDVPFIYRLQNETEPIKHLHNLVDKITPWSLPKDWRMYSVGHMVSLLARRLKNSNIGLLMLASCDRVDHWFFDVIFDVMKETRDLGHECGLVLSGRGTSKQLQVETANHRAWIRQYVHVPKLTVEDTMAVLDKWCKGGAEVAVKAEAGEDAAIEAIDKICEGTGGNIGTLKIWAQVKNLQFPEKAFSPQLVKDVFGEMIRPI